MKKPVRVPEGFKGKVQKELLGRAVEWGVRVKRPPKKRNKISVLLLCLLGKSLGNSQARTL